MNQLKQNANVVDAISNNSEEALKQTLEAVTNGSSNITILELPQKGSPSEFEVSRGTKIYLSDEWVAKAKKDNIPYPTEYF